MGNIVEKMSKEARAELKRELEEVDDGSPPPPPMPDLTFNKFFYHKTIGTNLKKRDCAQCLRRQCR